MINPMINIMPETKITSIMINPIINIMSVTKITSIMINQIKNVMIKTIIKVITPTAMIIMTVAVFPQYVSYCVSVLA